MQKREKISVPLISNHNTQDVIGTIIIEKQYADLFMSHGMAIVAGLDKSERGKRILLNASLVPLPNRM